MNSHACPHCGQLVEIGWNVASAICPQCYNPFAMPKRSHWSVMVVPLLVLYQFVMFTC